MHVFQGYDYKFQRLNFSSSWEVSVTVEVKPFLNNDDISADLRRPSWKQTSELLELFLQLIAYIRE